MSLIKQPELWFAFHANGTPFATARVNDEFELPSAEMEAWIDEQLGPGDYVEKHSGDRARELISLMTVGDAE